MDPWQGDADEERAIADGFARFPLPTILRAAREHLDMDVVFLARVRDGFEVFVAGDGAIDRFGPVREGAALPLSETFCRDVLECRELRVIADTGELPEEHRLSIVDRAGIGAYVGVPVVLPDGSIYGTLCFLATDSTAALSKAQLRFAEAMGTMAASWLDEARWSEREIRARQAIAREGGAPGVLSERAERMLGALCETFGWRACVLWLVDTSVEPLAAAGAISRLPLRQLVPLAGGGSVDASAASAGPVCRAVHAPGAVGRRLADCGVRTEVSLPVIRQGTIVGFLQAFLSDDRETVEKALSGLEGRALHTLGEHIGDRLVISVARQAEVLSERERAVLSRIASGDSVEQAAADLGLSVFTVRAHLRNSYDKLGVRGQAAAVAAALRRGLIE